jgi:hypothetical protein
MTAIAPFRYLIVYIVYIVYPAMLRAIERQWRERLTSPRSQPKDVRPFR